MRILLFQSPLPALRPPSRLSQASQFIKNEYMNFTRTDLRAGHSPFRRRLLGCGSGRRRWRGLSREIRRLPSLASLPTTPIDRLGAAFSASGERIELYTGLLRRRGRRDYVMVWCGILACIRLNGRGRIRLAGSFRETVAQNLQIIAGFGCNLQGGRHSEP